MVISACRSSVFAALRVLAFIAVRVLRCDVLPSHLCDRWPENRGFDQRSGTEPYPDASDTTETQPPLGGADLQDGAEDGSISGRVQRSLRSPHRDVDRRDWPRKSTHTKDTKQST